MRLRRFGVLVCAAVLSLGTVGAVSAIQPVCNPEEQVQGQCPEWSEDPSAEPTHEEPSREPSDDPSAEPTHEEPTWEPTDDESAEPTHDESAEPTDDESAEPTDDESAEPTDDESAEPTAETEAPSGVVAGLTSNPTLPPTDAIRSGAQQGPDATLPLVLLILGSIGLASFGLVPKRGRR